MFEPSGLRRCSNDGYYALSADSLPRYLVDHAAVANKLGGTFLDWHADERGDGNLNLVFIVTGPSGAVVVKQALPYVRMVGDSWPLALARAHYEHAALLVQAVSAKRYVPAVYAVDEVMALTIMEYLTPHVILRKGFVNGVRYPRVGEHLGEFLALTLFNTSDLHLSAERKKQGLADFLGNTAMCKITEDLIFDEPYFDAPLNRHTTPQLDSVALRFRRDDTLKLAVQEMKWRFMNCPECLLHGDLHSGSVMVSADDTKVIDPEFAFYGPMGFDVGLLWANILLAYLSQSGHDIDGAGRSNYRAYLLEQAVDVWNTFRRCFAALWHARAIASPGGELMNPRLSVDAPALEADALDQYFDRILNQALGFAGCEMIRRILGLAHVEDMESIADVERRAVCEGNALEFGRRLLVHRDAFRSFDDVLHAARSFE